MDSAGQAEAAIQWVSTDEAATALNVHPMTLRTWRYSDIGLKAGTHFQLGMYSNSPLKWNVAAIRKFIDARRGVMENTMSEGQ